MLRVRYLFPKDNNTKGLTKARIEVKVGDQISEKTLWKFAKLINVTLKKS